MKNLPIGYSSLSEMINGNTFYVDKTRHIYEIASKGKYYFLSRPRRFGKSLTIDTLKQLFLGEKALFKGLYIEDKWDFDKTFPVIHFSFGRSKSVFSEESLLQWILRELSDTAKYYGLELDTSKHYDLQFDQLIKSLFQKTKKRVVLLVDEYDKPILDVITQSEEALRNREILKGLYSVIKDNDACLRFVFLTGVSKFSKVSLFSGLNNLEDISFRAPFADLCGYTQDELESTFAEYLKDVDLVKLKTWYNGYNFDGTEAQKVYNPFDILLFFSNGARYQSYWFETGTPSFLVKLISQRRDIIPDLENYKATPDSLNSIDVNNTPIAALMLQSGYLTVKEQFYFGQDLWYRLGYPNFEVKTALNRQLTKIGITQEDATMNQLAINNALLTDNWQQFEKAIASFYSSIPYDYYVNTPLNRYEGYYCAIIYSYFAALGYDVKLEDNTSEGRIDMSIVIPYKKVIIFEFKVSHGENLAAKAVQQIVSKNYAAKFTHLELPIYQVGISFDHNKRTINGFEVLEQK
ncbi:MULTISPECIES: ATP-binding protein [Cysteiniphilum]|uniref:ATP-binding protein n=1 Tax=Cysteiniphilum TaxID=2056696 RepID=UPI0017849879|nr:MULTISPECIES: ATP-binding protein [Cysteiniphilum]